MDLFDIAVARKLSSGGGGGSSDFSTAEVTFAITGAPSCSSQIYVMHDESPNGIAPLYDSLGPLVSVMLYKGSATGEFYTIQPITTYSGDIVLGEAELEDGTYITPFTITGDCAVTLVGEGMG